MKNKILKIYLFLFFILIACSSSQTQMINPIIKCNLEPLVMYQEDIENSMSGRGIVQVKLLNDLKPVIVETKLKYLKVTDSLNTTTVNYNYYDEQKSDVQPYISFIDSVFRGLDCEIVEKVDKDSDTIKASYSFAIKVIPKTKKEKR